jgi:Ca2+-binding EF-hand superfamily protein
LKNKSKKKFFLLNNFEGGHHVVPYLFRIPYNFLIFFTRSHIDIQAQTLFTQADKDGSKKLDTKEIIWVLEQMNIHVKLSELKNIFKRFDSDKDETFQFPEFRLILRDLMFKKELVEVFKKYVNGDRSFESNPDQPIMTVQQLIHFFADSQGEHFSSPLVQEIIMYFAQDNKRKEYKMSFLEFSQLIFSIHNQAFEPMKTRVYQVCF